MNRWLPAAACVVFGLGVSAAQAVEPTAASGASPLVLPGAGGSTGMPSITEQPLLPSSSTGQRGVQVRTNVLSGTKFQAGPTIDYRPSTPHPELPAITTRNDRNPVELGGFVGYLFHDQARGQPASSLGVDLQFSTDPKATSGTWLVQPGIDYSTPLADSLQLNTRLFSTYAPDGTASGSTGFDRGLSLAPGSTSDPGFQDVGVGLGLGYTITDKWAIQTQARYQRMLGAGDKESDKENSPHQFFGGVMVDYKF